jgi:hypothetical protein
MQKPVGVIVIAVLDFIGTAILGCVGLLAFVAMGFLASRISEATNGQLPPAVIAGLGIFLGLFCLFFAAVAGALGYGMLSLKEWARIVQMVFAGIGIAFGLLGLLGAMLHFHVFGLIIVGIRLAINGAIIWYLLQPHVKAAFQARAAAAPAR